MSDARLDMASGLKGGLMGSADIGDYVTLLKPRVMSLVVFTALVGIMAAPGGMHPLLAAVSLVSIAIGGGASGALNMWYEADLDAKMRRTAKRPIPAGLIERDEALAFGVILAAFSVLLLGLAANWLAAGLLAFTIVFYAVIYTMWLKPFTAQNIVIGGAAGALPPVVGWAAVTGGVSLEPIVLFLIIFMWTPPHFWALALFTSEDYARAGVPMLPNVAGEPATRRQILIYTGILAPLGALPWFLGHAGPVYGIAALLLGAEFVRRALLLLRQGEAANHAAAKRVFGFSLTYLFALFAIRLAEVGADKLMAADVAPETTADAERARRRRRRSIALALILAVLVIVVYAVTVVRLGPGVMDRPL